jgi:hypothetical protein
MSANQWPGLQFPAIEVPPGACGRFHTPTVKRALCVLWIILLACSADPAEGQAVQPVATAPAGAAASPTPAAPPTPAPPPLLPLGCTVVPGQACNKSATATPACPDGCALSGGNVTLTCFANKCYSFPRAINEPCVNGELKICNQPAEMPQEQLGSSGTNPTAAARTLNPL